MNSITIENPKSRTADIQTDNIEILKQFFPEACIDGKIDFETLKQLLSGVLDESEEKYGLNWNGKRRARQLSLTPSTGTLRPSPEEGLDWNTTQNLMIEGDNLEVLKLLKNSYPGKVKLIYIDPPYNTGNDRVYPDDFHDNVQNYLELTGQVEGNRKISSNTETSGRYHTDWLNMMYPRLRLARNLLTKDGAIFVSCDETEHPRLRAILDDIFGQENFIADMVWAAGRKNDSRFISISHEYIVCYAYDIGFLTEQKIEWRQRKKGLEDIYNHYDRLKRKYGNDFKSMTAEMKSWYEELKDSHEAKAHKHYSHIDANGIYFPADISWPGGGGPKYEVLHPRTQKPVAVPSRGWSFATLDEMQRQMADNRIHFGDDETLVPCYKSYLKEHEYQAPYSVFYQDGRAATKRLRTLMEGDCFDFPKDEFVLQEIIGMMTSKDDIIIDFFAGSGTTGHAVMAQNSLDGGNRRYVLVQLPERLDPEKNDQKNAALYCDQLGKSRNIAELTKERLRRAANKIKHENPNFSGDLGFRVYKLDSSNIRIWDPDRQNLEKELLDNIKHIKDDRNDQDILCELLLKFGLDLCIPIETHTIAGKVVHSIGAGTLFACLDTKIAVNDVESLALGIVAWHKELAPASESAAIFLDSAFENDLAKTNLAAILEQHGFEKDNIKSL